MPFVKDAPKPPPPKNEKPKAAAAPSPKLAERTESAESGFQFLAMGATMAGLHADAAAIGMHAEAISPEIAKLAEDNATIAKGLDWLTVNGPYAAIISVSLPLVLQLAVNHKVIKAESIPGSGVVNPGVLEARWKLGMTQKATAMLKEQKRLEEELIIAQMEFQTELNEAMERNAPTNGEDAPAE